MGKKVKNMDKLLELFKKLPEKCVEEVAQSCVDILEHHLKNIEMFGKCSSCNRKPHDCVDICECWKRGRVNIGEDN